MGILVSVSFAPSAQALEEWEVWLRLPQRPNLRLLNPALVPRDGSVVTAQTVSEAGLTVPSLWWTWEQFGEKLVINWIAYSGDDGTPQRIDLVINQQVWRGYSYWQRYAFLNQFGRVSQEYGYDTRIFNQRQPDPVLLGAYLCNAYDGETSAPTPSVEMSESQSPLVPEVVIPAVNDDAACEIYLDLPARSASRTDPLVQ